MVWNKYCFLGIVFPILLFAFIIDKVLSNTHEQVLLDHIYFLLLWTIVVLFVRILSKTGSSFQTRFTFFSKTCQQLLDLCNGTSRIQTLEKRDFSINIKNYFSFKYLNFFQWVYRGLLIHFCICQKAHEKCLTGIKTLRFSVEVFELKRTIQQDMIA